MESTTTAMMFAATLQFGCVMEPLSDEEILDAETSASTGVEPDEIDCQGETAAEVKPKG